MLIRISLIFAVVAALAVGTLNIVVVRDKINTLITQRDNFHTQRDQARRQLADTRQKLSKTESDLTQTQQDLTNTMTRLTTALADVKTQTARADNLATNLAKTTVEMNNAQNQLAAYQATGYQADQVAGLAKTIKANEAELAAIKEENGVLNLTVHNLRNQLYELIGSNVVVTLPADLKGKVLAVDPKWDFVVLNIGEEQGVLDNGELLVSRNGKLVAKVIVRSIQKDRSIANVMPGWQLGQVFEGDIVTPAHPAT